MSQEPNLVVVQRCYGLTVAQIYKSKLEAAGIPVLLQYESAGPVIGITVDGLGQVRVLVPEELAARAEALLVEQADDSPDAGSDPQTEEQ